jgi:hypothetical protein
LIQKLMMKEPAERYQSAREVHAAIEALADDPSSILTTRDWNGPPPKGVRSDVIKSVTAPSAVALAATAETPIPGHISGQGPVSHPSTSLDRPPVTRRWVLPVVALVILGAGGLIGWRVMRSNDEPASTAKPAATPPDAEQPIITERDAASEPDVAVVVDAPEIKTTDVVKPKPPKPNNSGNRPPRDAGVVAPPKPDAAIVAPPPDAAVTVPKDAGVVAPPDAKPDIDIIRKKN